MNQLLPGIKQTTAYMLTILGPYDWVAEIQVRVESLSEGLQSNIAILPKKVMETK